MRQDSLLFFRHTASVIVSAKPAFLQSLQEKSAPYLHTEHIANSIVGTWTIVAGFPAPQSEYEVWPISSSEEPVAEAYVVKQSKTIFLPEQEDEWLLQRALRMVRNILRLQLASQGAIFLHAGMVTSRTGRGIAYVGAKQTGKTSSILAALIKGAHFVANDDLAVFFHDQRFRALGWPRSISIRPDTLATLTKEKPMDVSVPSHPSQRTLDPAFQYFSPGEIARIFQCQLVPETDLHTLIFPEFLPRASSLTTSLQPIYGQEALALAQEHIEPCIDEYHGFLIQYFPPIIERPSLEKFVPQMQCYRLRQSFSALTTAIDLIDQSELHERLAGENL